MIIMIPGKPIPLKRPRFANNKAYDSQKPEKLYYGLLMKKGFNSEPLCCPVEIALDFAFQIPKSKSTKINSNHPHTSIPDLDNLIKFVKDAGNGILWRDDCLIHSVIARKFYDTYPYTKITI